MFTQLSLFDSAPTLDTAASTAAYVHVASTRRPVVERGTAVEQRQMPASARELKGRDSASRSLAAERRSDELRPMGELAQLVLARYDLLASRRQERERRRREQPRKSIRVLSPSR